MQTMTDSLIVTCLGILTISILYKIDFVLIKIENMCSINYMDVYGAQVQIPTYM